MPAELSTEQIKHILQGIKIPPQPQIMVDLQMEQALPEPDLEHITTLIKQDVGLAGAILKFVNSSFFALSNTITSIDQAVNILGYESVINIVNGLSIKGQMSDETIVQMNRFWDSAMDTAMIATHIAKQIGYHTPDEAYILGLFHNAGIPLLMERYDNYLSVIEQAYSVNDGRIIDIENIEFNTNHAVLGYYIAKSWNLPAYICETIADHHSVAKVLEKESDAASNKKKTLLCILKISEHIEGLYKVLGSQEVDHEWEKLKESILLFLGLSQYDYNALLDHFDDLGIGEKASYE